MINDPVSGPSHATSNYEAIRASSRERYGTDISNYGPALLANLYSSRTHFIFELLQNAEDAGAKQIYFRLFPDRLEVSHNGQQFSQKDVLSICSIARSTKREDLTQIGKFGIGFKAVYAYSHSPTIHSGLEHFQIRDFVHPWPVDRVELLSGETLFVFPFDHPDISAELAYREILDGLLAFEPHSLLFLRNLARFEIEVRPSSSKSESAINSVCRSVLQRDIRNFDEASSGGERFVHVAVSRDQDIMGIRRQDTQEWLRLEASGEMFAKHYRVSVAFKLVQGNLGVRIERVTSPPVFVYFPTEKFMPTGFLVQGPFRTTPARDNIPGEDEWNLFLSQEVAKVAKRAFLAFAKSKLLDAKSLECLPTQYQESTLFKPIFSELVEMVKTEPIIPVDGGGYARASVSLIPRGEELRKLFSQDDLRLLTGLGQLNWTAQGINSDPLLAKYWKDNGVLAVVDAGEIVTLISRDFLSGRTDEWMKSFYLFLLDHKSLLKSALKQKPFLRTETNDHIYPLDSLGKPVAYLPGESTTDFPTLKKVFAEDNQVRILFSHHLGLKKPGMMDILNKYILPLYARQPISVSKSDNSEHIRTIAKAVQSDGGILRLIEHVTFLRCERQTEAFWGSPSMAYLRSGRLIDYFGDCPNCVFVSSDYGTEDIKNLGIVGCANVVRVKRRSPGPQNYVRIKGEHGDHARGVDGFDPDFQIDGLDYVLSNPTLDRAKALWNDILVEHALSIEGAVEESSQHTFPVAQLKRTHQPSKAGRLLLNCAWLPDREGRFKKPSDLSLEELPEGFVQSEQLVQKLKMRASALTDLAKQRGVDPAVIDFALKYPEMILEIQKRMAKDALDAAKKAEEPSLFVPKLEESFSRPSRGSASSDEYHAGGGKVGNAAFRRDRLNEELSMAKGLEPEPVERMTRVTRRIYEEADDSLRSDLEMWYQGKCQICSDVFPKRDGSPYFEAVTLVPRSLASWLDTVGNLLCLCAGCSARLRFGAVNNDGLVEQIRRFRTLKEGGGPAELQVLLCGVPATIRYVEKHMLALQVLVEQEMVEKQDEN